LSDEYKVKGESVSVTSSRANEISQAHVKVVVKMREREPGSEPQSGDRVTYVLVRTDVKKASQGERAEDPQWVKTHNIPLDYEYYFTNKFMNPVCDLLEPLVENPKQEIFGDMLEKKKTRDKGQATVDGLFKKYNQSNSK